MECRFLVPEVRDSDRRRHTPKLWTLLVDVLRRTFGAFTGPEGPIAGGYTNRAGQRVDDRSFRYTVALARRRLPALRHFLGRAARSFDQECLYLAVGGLVEFIPPDPDVGLEG